MASPPLLDDPNHAARRAKTRIAVAAVLLTIAIGGLTLLSRQQPSEKVEETIAQKQQSISSAENPLPNQEPAPAQISSKDQETPPQTVEPVKPEVPVTPPTPVAAVSPVTSAPPPPPPQVINPQPLKYKPAPVTKSAGPAAAVPSEPIAPAEPVAKKAPVATSWIKQTEPPQQVSPAPQSAPVAQAKTAAPPKNFVVQVGVFTDMDNAKQLQSKLAENGIPSHTETKLQLGPFNTKAEADAAKEKLKNLGIGSVVVPGK